jgi:hypothetical protein
MFRKKKKEKYTLDEYREMQKLLAKKHFRFEPYPWPVTLALLLPLALFILLIISYVLHIRNAAG